MTEESGNLRFGELAEVDRIGKQHRHDPRGKCVRSFGLCTILLHGWLGYGTGTLGHSCLQFPFENLGEVDYIEIETCVAPIVDCRSGTTRTIAALAIPNCQRH